MGGLITRDELIAALNAQGMNLGVQVRLDCVPLEITGVHLDERDGRINLTLDEAASLDVLRASLARVSASTDGEYPQGPTILHNARGRWQLLNPGEE